MAVNGLLIQARHILNGQTLKFRKELPLFKLATKMDALHLFILGVTFIIARAIVIATIRK
jgi:hypothetical protein